MLGEIKIWELLPVTATANLVNEHGSFCTWCMSNTFLNDIAADYKSESHYFKGSKHQKSTCTTCFGQNSTTFIGLKKTNKQTPDSITSIPDCNFTIFHITLQIYAG